jgi:cytochrome c peroxidase
MRTALVLVVAFAGCTDPAVEDDAPGDDAPADDGSPEGVLDLPATPYAYEPDLPAHFLLPPVTGRINTPADNPITDLGATLGRVLFYDTELSANRTVACASCHDQATGFADTLALSTGFDGGDTGRNSMGLADTRYYQPGTMFWDERASTLEAQTLMPIQDAIEMGMTLDGLVARLQTLDYYPPLFAAAFGDGAITTDRVSKALAQFVRSIVSYRSRYDVSLAAAGTPRGDFPAFTAQENLGKRLFFAPPGQGRSANCAVCHLSGGQGNVAIFLMDQARNNGLHADTSDDDGVGNGRFKSPSLRNVALTAPFMHDGSLATLRDVVQHYSTGIEAHPNLDPRLRAGGQPNGQPQRLNLTADEIDAVVAFLGTLTDTELAADPKFSDPFVDH